MADSELLDQVEENLGQITKHVPAKDCKPLIENILNLFRERIEANCEEESAVRDVIDTMTKKISDRHCDLAMWYVDMTEECAKDCRHPGIANYLHSIVQRLDNLC